MQTKLRSIRDGFGEALLELGHQVPNVLVVSADLAESVRIHRFGEQFPERFFEVGVAEQNMVGVAAGLAKEGFVVFSSSFAAFSPGRTFDQIRVSVALSQRNVKIVGGHAGLTVGEDGATHQMLEDLAMMRALPNMAVYIPADFSSAKQLTHLAAKTPGPAYIRLSRHSVVDLIPEGAVADAPVVLRPGDRVTIVTAGVLGQRALALADAFTRETGVHPEVVALLQLKPLNTQAWVQHLSQRQAIICLEEHQEFGGVGSTLAEILGKYSPRPLEIIGVPDTFGTSGPAEALLDDYGFTPESMWDRVRKFLERHQVL